MKRQIPQLYMRLNDCLRYGSRRPYGLLTTNGACAALKLAILTFCKLFRPARPEERVLERLEGWRILQLITLACLVHVTIRATCIQDSSIQKDPLLVVALMIKNEGPVIDYTLSPMVEGGIDSFLIFDTGSTDDTIEKVTEFFSTHSITNFTIVQEDFVDFATSRNRALDLVDEYFPEATFIMMPDAEWLLRNGKELLQFCAINKHDWHASYLMHMIRSGQLKYSVDRLMRRSSHCRFKSPVHEYLESPSATPAPTTFYFAWNATAYGDDKSSKRWKRDVGFLLKAYAEDPNNARTAFYLAQTYACLGDKENAFRFYERRSQLPAWDEENYETIYRLAETVEDMALRDAEKQTPYDWSLAQWYYLKAFSMRPTRIEAIIRIANHYLSVEDYASAFLFAARAAEIPMPEHEILFVQKDMYDYTRYDIMAQAGLKIGEYEKGEWAVRQALENRPDDQHLSDLLKLYLDRQETGN